MVADVLSAVMSFEARNCDCIIIITVWNLMAYITYLFMRILRVSQRITNKISK
jgi:hypothetical protein